jgi:RHO1 GDP-GTP exchange protein 1/2
MSRVHLFFFIFAGHAIDLTLQPLPLSYLRLGSFNGPPEQRKEKVDDGGLFRSTQTVPAYPFTIYHAAGKQTRRYTLYVASDNVRRKWADKFRDAIGVEKVKGDANQVRTSSADAGASS